MYPIPQRMGKTSIFRSRKEASSIGRADDPSESMRGHLFDKTGKFALSGRVTPGTLPRNAFVAFLRRAYNRGGGRRRCDIGRGRRRCRRHNGRGRCRVLMHINAAGKAQECQRKQKTDAHRTYPSGCGQSTRPINPVPWRVRAAFVAGSWPAITSGCNRRVVDCRPPIADPYPQA